MESRPEYRAYHYVIPVDDAHTFVAATNIDLAEDNQLAKAVLDSMMASLTFE
jgi:hypothetical protein